MVKAGGEFCGSAKGQGKTYTGEFDTAVTAFWCTALLFDVEVS